MRLLPTVRGLILCVLASLLATAGSAGATDLDHTSTLPFRTSVSEFEDGWMVVVRDRSSPAGRNARVKGSVWELSGGEHQRLADGIDLPPGELALDPLRTGFLVASINRDRALDCTTSDGQTECWPVLEISRFDESNWRRYRNSYSLKQNLPTRLQRLGPGAISDLTLDFAADRYLLVMFRADSSQGREYCRVALYPGPQEQPVQQLHSYCTELARERSTSETRRLPLNREQILLGPTADGHWHRAEPGQSEPLAGDPIRFDLVQSSLGNPLTSQSSWRPGRPIFHRGILGRLSEGYPLFLERDGTPRLLTRGAAGELLVRWSERGALRSARRLPPGWHLAGLSAARNWQGRPGALLYRTGSTGGLHLAAYSRGGLSTWRLTRDELRAIKVEQAGGLRAALDALTTARSREQSTELSVSPAPPERVPHAALDAGETTWLVHRPEPLAPTTGYTVIGRTGGELREVGFGYPERENSKWSAVPAQTRPEKSREQRKRESFRERYREVFLVPLEDGSLQMLRPRAAFTTRRGSLLLRRDESGEVQRVRRISLTKQLTAAGMPPGSGGRPVHTGWSETAESAELVFRGPEARLWACPVTGETTVFGVCQRMTVSPSAPVHEALFGGGSNPLAAYGAGMDSGRPVFLEGWTGSGAGADRETRLRSRPLARHGRALLGVLERPAAEATKSHTDLLARWNRKGHLQAARALPAGIGALGARGTEPDSIWFHRYEPDGHYSLIGYHFNAAPAHSWVHYRAGDDGLQRVQPAELSRQFRRAITGVYTPE